MVQPATPEELQARLEELKDELYRLDRAASKKFGSTTDFPPQEKKQRQVIVREIGRLRRQHYRALAGPHQRRRKVILRLTEEEYQALAERAEAEGLALSHYLRNIVREPLG